MTLLPWKDQFTLFRDYLMFKKQIKHKFYFKIEKKENNNIKI